MAEIIPEYERPAPGEEQDLLSIITDRLSGRWIWAIALGIVLSAVAAVAGFRSTGPMYESAGIIQVAPRVLPVMHETAETAMLPMYTAFVQTQATLISSDRVLERAALSLEDMPWGDVHEAVAAIRGALRAEVDRNSQLIVVRYTAASPHMAQQVVNAVIRAYDDVYASAEIDEINRKLNTLRITRRNLEASLRQRRSREQELISDNPHAVGDLTALMQTSALRIQEHEAQMRRLEHAVAMDAGGRHDGDAATNGLAADARELELFDEGLARLGRQLDEARSVFNSMRSSFGERHLAYREARRTLQVLEREYRERQVQVMEQFAEGGLGHPGILSGGAAERLADLQETLQIERERLREMGRTSVHLADLHSDIRTIEGDLDENRRRINELETEADAVRASRISVQSYGDRPLGPARDRRKALAAVGAIGGFGASMGFFFLLGTFDRRVYAVRQLTDVEGGARLLGVLPALPQHGLDSDAGAVAAHCVHQIRNQIELLRPSDAERRGMVIAISSPYQGDGKTSLVLALGASYAASGTRTALVDSDVVGQMLTHQLWMDGELGLKEALKAGEVSGYAKPLRVDNLHALPVGADDRFGPEKMRRDDLEAVFNQMRKEYDIVLVDTGPLFGSVESLPVAAAVDGVVLLMWRGRSRLRLIECIELLRSVGGRCLGVVLNYARNGDCMRYVSKSHTSVPAGELDMSPVAAGTGRRERLAGKSGRDARRADRSSTRAGRNGLRNILLEAMQTGGRR
jgi:polysaccharide biosynthesis transport protein